MTAFEKHEAESRAFRIIEERTGLSHSDIEQLYQLQSDEHKKYARRWFERIDWNQDVRIVLAGILHFCCDGDRANAERATLFWLGDEHIGKYGYKGDIINLLKQRYPDFAITLKSPDSIPYKRFEQLLQSTERTRQWTVESIRKEFHRKPDWGSEDNKILWSGLRQYCGMTEYGAMKFLSDRYGWKIKNTHKRPNQATGRTMKNQGNSINDFAPIGTADEPKARAQFEALLALQTSPAGTPWSIARVIEARKRGDFKK